MQCLLSGILFQMSVEMFFKCDLEKKIVFKVQNFKN